MLADIFFPCSAALSQLLRGLPFVALHTGAPLLPFQNTWWAGSGRRAWLPAPLSYVPHTGAGYLHPMVHPPCRPSECFQGSQHARLLVPLAQTSAAW